MKGFFISGFGRKFFLIISTGTLANQSKRMFDKVIRVLMNVINYIKRGINYIKRLITGGDRGSVFYYMQF